MATVELHTVNGGEMESYDFPGMDTDEGLALGMVKAERHFDGPCDGAAITVTSYGPVGEVRQGRVTWTTADGKITWEVAHFGRMV